MIRSKGEKTFQVINYTLLAIMGIACLYPFLYVLSASLSTSHHVVTGNVLLFPKGLTLDSYREVLGNPKIWSAYGNTIFYTIVGTTIAMIFTVFGSYALSKKQLRGRGIITIFITLTLWFDAGMIPFFLTLRGLNLLNTRTAIIIAFACDAYKVILLRTNFESIPAEMEEAAEMDGATPWQILTQVYLPLSKPTIATVSLFYAVEKWNGYFWAMIILTDEKKIPLQVLLKQMIVEHDYQSEVSTALDFASKVSSQTITYATIIVSIIPIVLVYPYIQKYFVQGVMLGSVKG